MARWLLKTEPESFGWNDLVAAGGTRWDGVRNAQAAINLRAMAVGDEALIYHSVSEKAAVGVARVTTTAYPDLADPTGRFVAVDIAPERALYPVTLARMKACEALAGLAMLRQSRLSVSPVTDAEWTAILALADQPQP